MAFVKTTDKNLIIRNFINLWLKDNTFYCNNCGEVFNPAIHIDESCCEDPQIARNIDHIKGLTKQNKEIRDSLKNDYASNESKTMRLGISLTPKLLRDLEQYFRKEYNEKLFNNTKELHSFMRAFPEFTIAKKI